MFFFILFFGSMGNLLHKWNHRKIYERPKFIKILQKYKLMQGPTHHSGHHKGDADTAYCVFTPLLNPLLDKMGFWRRVEKVVCLLTGIKANGPDEPYKYFKVKDGKIMEYDLRTKRWNVWEEKKIFDKPIRR